MFGSRVVKVFASFNVVLAALVLVSTALAAGTAPSVSNVYWFADATEVQGATSQLLRMEDGVKFHINTKGLYTGHIYTVWAVTFNASENCSPPGCGEDDIFNPDSTLNLGQIAAAEISVYYAGGFQVNDSAGVGNVVGTFYEGLPGGAGQAFGPPFSQTGLGDAQTAEVHFVVRDHGPSQPGLFYAQISTFGGGCNNVPPVHPGYAPGVDGNYACEDVQFAVHLP